MIWTSKESIYKAVGLKGISFSDNIKIEKVVEEDKTRNRVLYKWDRKS